MKPLLTLLTSPPYIELPRGVLGWAGWLVLLALLAYFLWRWKDYNKALTRPARLALLVLLLAAPIAGLFLGLRIPPGNALPPPGLPIDPTGPAVMLFAALPWALAAGLLGPLPAALVAALSGLVLAFWETHSLFTPLEIAFLAVLYSALVSQRYRTALYKLVRRPVVAAALLACLYPLLFLALSPFDAQGSLVVRLDYALTHLGASWLAVAIEILLVGVFAEAVRYAFSTPRPTPAPLAWGLPGSPPGVLAPSPAEKSIQTRFLYNLAPLALALVLALIAGDWIVAGAAARSMLRDRMATAAQMAAETAPFFLEAGQNQVTQLAADPRLITTSPTALPGLLQSSLRSVPFFSQLYVLNARGELLAGYPDNQYVSSQTPLEEQMGVQLALNGVPSQSYTVPPAPKSRAAQVSFVSGIPGPSGAVGGVLIARSDLATNPLSAPAINSLNNLKSIGGQGFLLDESGRVLYHPDPALLMTSYTGRIASQPIFYDDKAPDGTRALIYYQRTIGSPWAVAISVPANQAQQLALTIAAPLLAIILILSVLAVLFLRLGLRNVTASLQHLAVESGRISQGQLDHALEVNGEDEVGQLRRAFEHMRISLKDRLDELNRLLVVSQGVASSLEVSEAVRPVLDAALASGAGSARIVLAPEALPELEGEAAQPLSFGAGPLHSFYTDLDEQILLLTRQQDRVILSNPTRRRFLQYNPAAPRPEALAAIALRHENTYYGALWVVFDRPHPFSDEEIRFLVTLASQAAIAAANARLFQSAEIGRQRLAAILASTPDPVLVTDQRCRLLLANPLAWQTLGMNVDLSEGQPIDRAIPHKELVALVAAAPDGERANISLPNGRTYLTTVSSVFSDGQRVGRVCILHDVTRFMELNALKSEFVATVSHDLRSPLTLMRGYATMLEMVGELNEQQTSYVRKIVSGVESMARLVNNLLDLGRIEAGVGLQLELVSVHDILDRVISALQPDAAQKKIQVSTEIGPHVANVVEADQALLQQALHNLLENAIKYTRAEGKVAVRVKEEQDRLIFVVTDTGIGISQIDQTRLFERFFRGAQQASKEQRGTGLGLAIVRSIAERHGGKVWVESQLGKGSTFYFAIPLRQPQSTPRQPTHASTTS